MYKLWRKVWGINQQQQYDKKELAEKQKMIVVENRKKKEVGKSNPNNDDNKPLLDAEDAEDEDADNDMDVSVDRARSANLDTWNDPSLEVSIHLEKNMDRVATVPEVHQDQDNNGTAAAVQPLGENQPNQSTAVGTVQELNALTMYALITPLRIIDQTAYLRMGQYIMLGTGYSYNQVIRDPHFIYRPSFHTLAISYSNHAIYPDCVRNGIITMAPNNFPCMRNVFRIKRAILPSHRRTHVRYQQPILLQLASSATPVYLKAGTLLTPGTIVPTPDAYSLRLTTTLSDDCYFTFQNRYAADRFHISVNSLFLVQHMNSRLYMTFHPMSFIGTGLGFENMISLRPLRLEGGRVPPYNFFQALYH